MEHPESSGKQGIEPSVGELLRWRQFSDQLEKLGPGECKTLCRQLGYATIVTYPAALRWAAGEAARGLVSEAEKTRMSQELVRAVTQKGPEGPGDLMAA